MVIDYSNNSVNLFEALKTLPKQGVYLLKNEDLKQVFIGHSSNMPLSIIRNLENNKLFMPEYSFELLEVVESKINLLPRTQFYKDKYCNLGYNLINNNKVFNRKLRIDLINDFRFHPNGECLFAVKLISSDYRALTVGIFDYYDDVQSFVAANYCNVIYNIVFADNALTREYLIK